MLLHFQGLQAPRSRPAVHSCNSYMLDASNQTADLSSDERSTNTPTTCSCSLYDFTHLQQVRIVTHVQGSLRIPNTNKAVASTDPHPGFTQVYPPQMLHVQCYQACAHVAMCFYVHPGTVSPLQGQNLASLTLQVVCISRPNPKP